MASLEQIDFIRLPLVTDASNDEDIFQGELIPGDEILYASTLRTIMLAQPKKMSLSQVTNVENKVVAAYNPPEFEQSVPMEWVRMVAPGGSFSRIHFISTRNYTVDLELYWTAWSNEEVEVAEKARNQLLAWSYPEFTPGGMSVGPSRLHFIWPSFKEMTCQMIELKIKNMRFARDGRVTRWLATMKLEESLDSLPLQEKASTPSLLSTLSLSR